MSHHRPAAQAAILAVLAAAAASPAQENLQRIALTGTQVGNATLFSLGAPAITESGGAAFVAFTSAGNRAYIGAPDDLDFIVRSGFPAPGLPGLTLQSLNSEIIVSPSGKIAFSGVLSGPGVSPLNDEASWVGGDGSFAPYYREGTVYPGYPLPSMFGVGVQTANDQGAALLPLTVAGFQLSSSWCRQDGAFEARNVVQTPAPGASNYPPTPPDPGYTPMFDSFFLSALSPGGVNVFAALTTANRVGRTGIWLNDGDAIIPIALSRNDNTEDGFHSAIPSLGLHFRKNAPAINNAQTVVFAASRWVGDGTNATYPALFQWRPGEGLTRLFREGDDAPGGGQLGLATTTTQNCRVGGGGHIVFVGETGVRAQFPNPQPPQALYAGLSGGPGGTGGFYRVLAVGQEAAGLPDGTIYAEAPQTVFINASGDLAFPITVSGAQIGTRTCLYRAVLTPGGYQLSLVARTGQVVEIAPGDMRFISAISVPEVSSGGEDGFSTIINSAGVIAFTATFAGGGGQAVFRTGPTSPVCDSLDFNNDGLYPDTLDLVDFVTVFGGGECSNEPHCTDIDFNNDGLYPDNEDILSFFRVFGGGGC
jgi:hypothetical protein